ncbi:Crp/Fnr family transcriptional regulator [Pedobacter puniceum]|uniref:Helix-turn-helix domain-containing protein n=1 Tax=Pedobacter puniceum TaxID=2666136 RepID=A0A7K0FMK4_9SPHI|nr:Crp/Fnr family transcriptional regulator [Pedobacter puniceum]MRX47196.1 helix-turn-helix domain-containing protein [Pedobacter puniceum]
MKKSKVECDLQTCFMCKMCLKEWHPAIHAHRRTFQVKKGERIIEEGEKVTGVYFVFDGIVKVHKKWGDKELIVRFANKGAVIGHRGLGSKSSVYPISATALEASTVCFIGLEFFNATLKVNNEFTYQLLLFFADELQESERKMRNLAHMSVKGRVAQALFNLEEQFGSTPNGGLNISLTRQDLASYAGATYETVFRTINELVDHKILRLEGKDIIISDRSKLAALTNIII